MKHYVRAAGLLFACLLVLAAGISRAHDNAPGAGPLSSAQASAPPAGSAQPAEPAPVMDPLVRALVLGIAANILREAAAQPDPVDALGNAIERRIAGALADPNTLRLLESALTHALRDAPLELREPLALFATSLLQNMRREMLEDMRPRRHPHAY